MKPILAALILASFATVAGAADEPLLPEGVNQILGRVRPNMAQVEFEKIVQAYYPEARMTPSEWSGRTGYASFRLTSRYSIFVAEYSDPKDFNSRFIHTDLLLYMDDSELRRRLNISFHKWDEEKRVEDKNPGQQGGGYWPPVVRLPPPLVPSDGR